MRSLNIAATGMQAQQLMVDVISQNLANMNTTGFKQQRVEFQDLIYQDEKRAGTNSSDAATLVPTGIQIGLGVKTGAIYRDTDQGALQTTENALDVAILGKGFFQVELPNGTNAYTRAGSFQVNESGEIVTVDGFLVSPNITIPEDATSININQSGEVIATIQGQVASSNLGQFDIVSFVNDKGLRAVGNNLFEETEASGPANLGTAGTDGTGTIQQGVLESSNVNAVSEITNLIVAQRAYEMNAKIISASDEMLQSLNQSA
jgi:flagellar basal-body rod protein FlgG